jgi:hypothetical protein
VSNPEIEEFARALVSEVRDAAIRSCDALLEPQAASPAASRLKRFAANASDLEVIIADIVDETVFALLQAIDQGTLRLKFVSTGGREIDLTIDGRAELSGWYEGSGGWRAMFSTQRWSDDYSNLDE